MHPDLIEWPLLSERDVRRVIGSVTDLRDRWSRKGGSLHTLGEPIYQHTRHMSVYYVSALEMNPLLWDAFGWVYVRLQEALEEWLEGDVRFAKALALPGFHVFAFRERGAFPGGSAHFDLQYESIEWPTGVVISRNRTPSFVLALELPQ